MFETLVPPTDTPNEKDVGGNGDGNEDGRHLLRRDFPGYRRPSPETTNRNNELILEIRTMADIRLGNPYGEMLRMFCQLALDYPEVPVFRFNRVASRLSKNPYAIRGMARQLVILELLAEDPPLSNNFGISGAARDRMQLVVNQLGLDEDSQRKVMEMVKK